MKYTICYSCSSHIGKYRSMNQDNFICDGMYMDDNDGTFDFPLTGKASCDRPILLGVFDGLGGEERGEIASLIAAKCASQIVIGDDPLTDLNGYCKTANIKICDYAAENGILEMGTTAALLAFAGTEIVLCNIGDSKIFLFAGGELEQISKDHLSIAPFGRKPPLSQNLGIRPSELMIEPYVAKGRYNDGDIYLICSDGLTDMIFRDEIINILKHTPFDKCVTALQEKALENGGKDNITIILCRVERKRIHLFRNRKH